MKKPVASIVVPCRNEAAHIEACLHSILALQRPKGSIEVLVVDGMSDDGTAEIVRQTALRHPEIRLLINPNKTTPHALNIGIRAAKSDTILRMDAHTEYAPDYLTECLRIQQKTRADNVGGPARTRPKGYVQRAIAAAYHSPFSVGGASFHHEQFEGETDTVPYGCFRRETLLRIGLFDEELVRNQDDELNYRIRRFGGRIWQSPTIKSWYAPRSTLQGLWKQYQQYGYWKVRVMQKHGAPASVRHVVPAAFLLCLVQFALFGFLFPPAWLALEATLLLYTAVLLSASIQTAVRNGLDLLPLLPIVFATYHFAYGTGWLLGAWDFLIRRSGRSSMAGLTRK
jgi:glycosyltransferase involved in cell wall biosynthesis